MQILTAIDDYLYFPILVIVMAVAALYFTFRTKFVQLRLFKESCRLIMENRQTNSMFLLFRP